MKIIIIIIIRKNEKKKIGADPEMGYCPLIIRQAHAARRWRGAAGRAAGARRRAGAGLGAGERQGLAGRSERALCARPCAAWACRWASRLCTRCTQPVLTQFRLSTVPESIFGENFFKKKIYFFLKKKINKIKLDKIFEKIKFSKIKFLLKTIF